MDNPALLILGMHRSGTSYLASVLQSLGVDIGKDLLGAQKGNPRGHFEENAILDVHMQLLDRHLEERGRAFDDGMLAQSPITGPYSEEDFELGRDALDVFDRTVRWGWKEPRTSLFLDYWKQLMGTFEGIVIYRHPLDVHLSLKRRGHWDFAVYADQAYKAYEVYNRNILDYLGTDPKALLFNANAGFADLSQLVDSICERYQLEKNKDLPEFHALEFKGTPISKSLHELFRTIQPDAAEVFDQLQIKSSFPYTFVERDDDSELDLIAQKLCPLLKGTPRSVRSAFIPYLEWLVFGKDDGQLEAYLEFGDAIGKHVRQVEEWNRKAAIIHDDNKRMSEEIERLGAIYKEQQEFLAKQTANSEKIWGELTRTGKSWEEQREIINSLLAEKRQMKAQIEELQKKLSEQ